MQCDNFRNQYPDVQSLGANRPQPLLCRQRIISPIDVPDYQEN